jgi:hypothetical protein
MVVGAVYCSGADEGHRGGVVRYGLRCGAAGDRAWKWDMVVVLAQRAEGWWWDGRWWAGLRYSVQGACAARCW